MKDIWGKRHQGGLQRGVATIVTAAMLGAVGAVTVVAPPEAQAAEPAPAISVDKALTQQVEDPTADASVLIGGTIGYTVTVSNSGAAGVGRAYNVSVRDVLPAGVAYKAGSASLGEPTIIANAPSAGRTTLLWTNLFDVTPAGEQTLTYTVTPDPAALPVGSTVTNAATAYATNDPFDITDFTPTGTCESACSYAASDSVSALINAITVRKSEVTSPENELVRGVHDNAAVYSIVVENNAYRPTTGVSLIDYLPAGLEFLSCGAVDNTTGDLREWTSLGAPSSQAPRLTVVPAPPSNCIQPSSVNTQITDPSGPAPSGLYTRVFWSLGDLAVGESRTISYRVGIPLFENTVTWPNGEPTALSLGQAANLDNNTGPSTAETASERSWTNYVNAVGRYQGPNVNGTQPVTINTYNRDTVTAEDLALDKSVSLGTFSIGGTATYTLRLRTSEYRTTTLTSLVDQLPDGLKYDDGSVSASLTTSSGTTSVPVTGSATSYASGRQTLTITPTLTGGILPTSATLTVTFTATMQAAYSTGAPTAIGDTYINTVSTGGRTTPAVCPNSPPGPAGSDDCASPQPDNDVQDTSSATLDSGGASVDKKVGQVASQSNCSAQTYGDGVPTTPFQVGDIVCFELTARFTPGGSLNNVLSPLVRDFLPDNVAFDEGSVALGPDNNVPAGQIDLDSTSAPETGGGSVNWRLGAAAAGGQYVLSPIGTPPAPPVFQVRFAARVVSAVLDQSKDIKGNLLKASAVNSAGEAVGARDQVDFEVAGSQVAVLKGVAQVNGQPSPPFPPNTDNRTVKADDVVTFRIDVANTGLTAAGSNVPVRNVRLVDPLPTGLDCGDVRNISDSGTCDASTNPDQIVWNPAPGEIAPGTTKTITYDVVIPSDVPVNANYVNRVTVTSYESQTNRGNWETQSPVGVTDISNVRTPNATVTKTGVTSLDLANNNLPNQFTVGEEITYTVVGTIPAGTTAVNGTITDTLPSTLQYVSSSGSSSGTPGTVSVSGRAVTLTLPASVTAGASPVTYTLTITAKVLGGSYTHGLQVTNTGRFRGTSFDRSTSYSARVVLPNPQIAKSNNASGPISTADIITYTLTVTNPSPASPSAANPARPTSYDTLVVDCVPAGMAVVDGSITGGGSAGTSGAGGDGCAAGTTRIAWPVGAVATTDTVTLTYQAKVQAASASQSLTNTATVTGSTLNDGKRDPVVEGVYSASATSSVRTSNGSIEKTVSPVKAPVGAVATWTITATYDDVLEFADATITDTIPVGVDIGTVQTLSVTCAPAESKACSTLTASGLGDFTPASSPSRTVAWKVGTVLNDAPDITVTVVYTARVQSGLSLSAGDVLTNQATSSYATCQPSSCPTASANLVVIRPELRVSKAVQTPTPTPGELYAYTVTVSNDPTPLGSDAYGVQVEDVVPDGVIVDATTISDGGTIAGATATGGGTITWTLAGPLRLGGPPVELTYRAKLPSSATSGTYTNTVDIPSYSSASTNGDTYNDVDPAEATVTAGTPLVDLAIVKTPSGSTTPGTEWTFSMQVSNTGPSDAESPIVVVDTLPVGMTYLSSGPDWNCLPFDQDIYCILEGSPGEYVGLAAGADAPPLILTVAIAATPETATYRNDAEVFTNNEDTNPGNNTSSATVTVAPIPVPPPNPDPGKPVDPTDPGKPVDPVDPDPQQPQKPTDPDPQKPGRPTVVPQRPSKPITPPASIEPGRPTVVLPATVTTNAGQKVRVDVRCRPLRLEMDKATVTLSGRIVPMGDVRYCDVNRSKKGRVTVTVGYRGPVLVKVTYSAKKVPGYTAFTKVKRYVVVPR